MRARASARFARYRALFSVLFVGAMGAGARGCCTCTPDIGSTPISPQGCPTPLPGPTNLTIQVVLGSGATAIQEQDGKLSIDVVGHRTATDVCFQNPTQTLPSIGGTDLGVGGSLSLTKNYPAVAPGAWTITVSVTSGGKYSPVTITPTFSPGASTILIQGNNSNPNSPSLVVTVS